jgi:hypothetical protein
MDAFKIFLGVVIFLIFIIIFISNIYILAYFSHPEDKMTFGIWYYRVLVILALSFANYLVFLVPLDIASAKRDDSISLGYNMSLIWTIINFLACMTVMFFLPLALIVYNNEEEGFKRIAKYALRTAGIILSFHILCCCLYYFFCGTSQIPVEVASNSIYNIMKSTQTNDFVDANVKQFYPDKSMYVELPLTFLVCCTLHITVLGSFFFVVIGGYGLAYAPMQFLNDFLNRPQIVKII